MLLALAYITESTAVPLQHRPPSRLGKQFVLSIPREIGNPGFQAKAAWHSQKQFLRLWKICKTPAVKEQFFTFCLCHTQNLTDQYRLNQGSEFVALLASTWWKRCSIGDSPWCPFPFKFKLWQEGAGKSRIYHNSGIGKYCSFAVTSTHVEQK